MITLKFTVTMITPGSNLWCNYYNNYPEDHCYNDYSWCYNHNDYPLSLVEGVLYFTLTMIILFTMTVILNMHFCLTVYQYVSGV